MDYIHVKNLEKYHPGYKDRNLLWCKIYFSMLNADPEFELVPEIDKWRFIAFVMLELQTKKPIPADITYLNRKGFDLKKRAISLTLKVLHNFIEVVTADEKLCGVDKEEDKEEDKDKELIDNFEKARKIYPGTKRGISEFQDFCKKYPKRWREIAPLLIPAILSQIAGRKTRTAAHAFVPDWKHFKTWINNHCWEEEGEAKPESKKHKCWGCGTEQVTSGTNTLKGTIWTCEKPECKQIVQAEIEKM